jgi:hypothetical protein
MACAPFKVSNVNYSIMKTTLTTIAARYISSIIPMLALLLMSAISNTAAAAMESDGNKASASSADVNMSVLTTPPVGGFKSGDIIDIAITVSNIDNSAGAFRLDIMDFPIFDNEPENYVFQIGSNAILREAEFSHGIFLRSRVNYNYDKLANGNEVAIEFNEYSDAYTWLIDTRFRNGSMQPADVATLHLKVEVLLGTYDFLKITNGDPLFDLLVEYKNTDNQSGGFESVSIPINITDVDPITEFRYYVTKIAPAGLQAGEPYLYEVGVIRPIGVQSPPTTVNLFLNQGFTPFAYNTFYNDVLPNTSPSNNSNSTLQFHSLSFIQGYIDSYYDYDNTRLHRVKR